MLKGIKGLPVKREACVIIAFLALLSLPLAALTEKEQDKSSEALNNSKTEASSRNWEIIADSMIYNGYDGNYEGNLNPVLQFTDVDVFGSGNCFNLLFAGIFLSLDYTISQKAEIPFNITIHTDGTAKLLGSDFTFYEKGEETDWTLKGPGCNLAVILSRDMDCGFSIKTTQLMNFSDYDSNDTAFVSPENTATYTGNLDLSYTYQPNEDSSESSFPVGFQIMAIPEVIYQLNYEDWGPEDNLYTHDDTPAYRGLYQVSCYNASVKRVNWKGQLSYLHGENLYQLEKWAVGSTNAFNGGPRLDGYYPGEFMTDESFLLNMNLQIVSIPDRVEFLVSYDAFYYGEKERLYQGSAVDLFVKLGNKASFNFRSGIGWNAERDFLPVGMTHNLLFRYTF